MNLQNIDKRKIYLKNYANKHKDKIKEYKIGYYLKNKKERIEEVKKYNIEHKTEISEYKKKYNLEHREERKGYNIKNKKKRNLIITKYYLNHKEERKEYRREYYLKKYQNDSNFKMKRVLRNALNNNLKKIKVNKWNSIQNILGYSKDELRNHINSQLKKEMNWNNYGKEWHIDHKVPSSWFYWRNNKNDIIESFRLENLRPLPKEENLQKSNYYCADVLLALSLIGR